MRGGGLHHPPGLSKEPGERNVIIWLCCADQAILFGFSLRCVGFSRCSVLKFPFKGGW